MADTAVAAPHAAPAPTHASNPSNVGRAGFAATLGACLLWATYPIYFKALGHAHPLELLSHRVIWAIPALALALQLLGGAAAWRDLKRALTSKATLPGLALSAGLITLNWSFYVLAVTDGRVLDASLGYFLSPLFSVALGVTILGERMSKLQALAVGLAALAVVNLVVGAGVFPFTALILAFSFALYGLVRKRLPVDPAVGLTAECLLALPVVALFVHHVATTAGVAFGQAGGGWTAWGAALAMMAAGPITVLPLFLFNYGAKRLPLSAVGLTLYAIPSLLFLQAVLLFDEPLDLTRAITFGVIWLGLALYSWESFRRRPSARKA